MMRLLLVEDDVRLAAALTDALRTRGFAVEHVPTAAEAIAAEPADVVLLDLGLPDGDGIDVIRTLRSRFTTAATGLIVVTARGGQADRVAGLRAGADDYVVKPLALQELVARIEAVARRAVPPQDSRLTFGTLQIDLAARRVSRGPEQVELTQKEFDLLAALAAEPGTAVPRDRLMLRVWQTLWPGTQRTLEVHVATLRAKLGDPGLIETVRGVGYRLAEQWPDNAEEGTAEHDR